MRLNGLQQQVVHQQNVFAQAQVQQAASQPAQAPVAKTSPSISSGLSSFGDRPPTFSKEHCETATRFAAVASETDW